MFCQVPTDKFRSGIIVFKNHICLKLEYSAFMYDMYAGFYGCVLSINGICNGKIKR